MAVRPLADSLLKKRFFGFRFKVLSFSEGVMFVISAYAGNRFTYLVGLRCSPEPDLRILGSMLIYDWLPLLLPTFQERERRVPSCRGGFG